MPAGGTWTSQNKRRPGAYINFNAIPAPNSQLGSSGTIVTLLPLDWGSSEGLIELTGEELLSGKSMEKVGYYYNDQASLPFRLALQNCWRMLIFRADTGGTEATATLGDVTFTAKYAGTAGNQVTIVAVANRPAQGKTSVSILYRGAVKETFVYETQADFETMNSAWVTAEVAASTGDSPITPTAGTVLTGGTNGTLDYQTAVPAFQDQAKLRDWSIMALPTLDENARNSILQFITDLREVDGKMVQVVVPAASAAEPPTDSEAVIATFQGYNTATEVVTAELFPLYVAGLSAGTPLGISNTCSEVVGATTIINPLQDGLVADYLESGWFLLTNRADGAVVIEQDINTLHTFTLDRPQDYSKNTVIRLLNTIAQDASLIFVRDFAGKVRNNKTGRDLFKSRMVTFFNTLQDADAIVNFVPDDIQVYAGEQPEGVVLDVAIQHVDAMEKLYMTVNIVA